MILIPQREIVLVLTPRTGSGSLKRAVMECYPGAIQLYRHMEADGVPHGYDRWQKVGVVRNPIDRLWSLYKFLGNMDGPYAPEYLAEQRNSVKMSFPLWITENRVVFTSAFDSGQMGRYYPNYAVRHPMPETLKSQFMYLRPDLGTKVFRYEDMGELAVFLGVRDRLEIGERRNATQPRMRPVLTAEAMAHVNRVCRWEIENYYPAAKVEF